MISIRPADLRPSEIKDAWLIATECDMATAFINGVETL